MHGVCSTPTPTALHYSSSYPRGRHLMRLQVKGKTHSREVRYLKGKTSRRPHAHWNHEGSEMEIWRVSYPMLRFHAAGEIHPYTVCYKGPIVDSVVSSNTTSSIFCGILEICVWHSSMRWRRTRYTHSLGGSVVQLIWFH